MSDHPGGMDPAQWPLLASDKSSSARSPSTDSSWRRSGGLGSLGSLGSLEEGVAQLSSGDTKSFRSTASPSEPHHSRRLSLFSSSVPQQRSPLSERAPLENRVTSGSQWHSSPVQAPTSSKPTRTTISDLFGHRSTETFLADPSIQNLASSVHYGGDVSLHPESSPIAPSLHRKSTTPWRFLSSPIRHSEDRGSRIDAGLISTSAASRGKRSLSETRQDLVPDELPLMSSASAGTVAPDEGRMVAHDSGMMTQSQRR